MFLVHRVETPQQRLAVQRLRYQIYVEEGEDPQHHEADHERRLLIGHDDDAPGTALFFVGERDGARVGAALRCRCWRAGALPEEIRATYSLDLLPPSEGAAICEISSLVVAPEQRGTPAVVTLVGHAFEYAIEHHGASLIFATCAPGLLRAYHCLGLYSYGGRPIGTSAGLILPLVALVDVESFRASFSPFTEILERLERGGALPSFDLSPFIRKVRSSGGVVIDNRRITAEVATALDSRRANRLAEKLGPRLFERLCERGAVVDAPPGTEVVQRDAIDQDLYLILEGALEVYSNGVLRTTLGPGETFGEIAFLSPGRRRSASVRAVVPSRLLVLSKATIEKLEEHSPRDALAVYKTLASMLVEWVLAREQPSADAAHDDDSDGQIARDDPRADAGALLDHEARARDDRSDLTRTP